MLGSRGGERGVGTHYFVGGPVVVVHDIPLDLVHHPRDDRLGELERHRNRRPALVDRGVNWHVLNLARDRRDDLEPEEGDEDKPMPTITSEKGGVSALSTPALWPLQTVSTAEALVQRLAEGVCELHEHFSPRPPRFSNSLN
jgi:hypothetical protein